MACEDQAISVLRLEGDKSEARRRDRRPEMGRKKELTKTYLTAALTARWLM